MTGSLAMLPGHADASPEGVAAYEHALEQLPHGALPAVFARMHAALEHADKTGDFWPFKHVLDSLLVTARLQTNGAYVLAVADADAEDGRGEHASEDVADFVARMRAKFGD